MNERKLVGRMIFVLLSVLVITGISYIVKGTSVPDDGKNSSETPVNSSEGKKEETSGDKADEGKSVNLDVWNLILVNRNNPVPQGYVPLLADTKNNKQVDARIAGALNTMLADGAAVGLKFLVASGYRSVEVQEDLYYEQVEKQIELYDLSYDEALIAAMKTVHYPGCSEHNLGLAADIVSMDNQRMEDDYEDTPEARWLLANCAKYGFILRYPKDKVETTGVIYEPWHFRYVGKEAAAYIMEQNLCLEEYLALSVSR